MGINICPHVHIDMDVVSELYPVLFLVFQVSDRRGRVLPEYTP